MKSLTLLPVPLLALITAISAQSPPATTTLPSGLQIEDTTPASCSRPSRPGDNIAVNYRGTLLSTGALFDDSYKRGKPFTFKLGAGQVISGWDEGLQRMCPGEGRKLTIPADLAYGNVAVGSIPAGSTLVFETVLEDIVGVEQLPGGRDRGMFASMLAAQASPSPSGTGGGVKFASTIESMASQPSANTTAQATATEATDGAFSIATAPPEPPKEEDLEHTDAEEHEPAGVQPESPTSSPPKSAECHLLGPFALLVQGALGVVAILSLVYKRWRETPKRPWKIFFFDVSKQVFGSMLTHILNLAMSMLGSVDMVNAAANAGTQSAPKYGRMPNPCSYYLLNLAIDTTIGIPILYILLKVLHALFLHTPLANPPESIKSGNYSQPPRATWWAKQLIIYFIGLTGMKLCVLFFFAAMPWLPWVGDWALRWTEGNEALQVSFAMFIFPLAMNAIQYWVIDNFIMDKKKGGKGEGYEAVADDEEEEHAHDQDSVTEVGSENADVRGKQQVDSGMLAEANPTPVDVEGSGRQTPVK